MINKVYKAFNDFSLYINGHCCSVLTDDVVTVEKVEAGKILVKIDGLLIGWMAESKFNELFRELK